MDSLTDGGPAFPIPDTKYGTPPGHQGMSLRDWFAGQALAGILAANAKACEEMSDKNVDQIVAREAYASADAMLEERKK